MTAGVPCASADWGGEGRGPGGGQASLWMPSPVGGLQWALDRRPVVGNVKCRFSAASWGCPVGDAQAERLACESGYGHPQRRPRTTSVFGELQEAIPGNPAHRGPPNTAWGLLYTVSSHTASQTSNPARPVDLRAAEILLLFEFENRLEEK